MQQQQGLGEGIVPEDLNEVPDVEIEPENQILNRVAQYYNRLVVDQDENINDEEEAQMGGGEQAYRNQALNAFSRRYGIMENFNRFLSNSTFSAVVKQDGSLIFGYWLPERPDYDRHTAASAAVLPHLGLKVPQSLAVMALSVVVRSLIPPESKSLPLIGDIPMRFIFVALLVLNEIINNYGSRGVNRVLTLIEKLFNTGPPLTPDAKVNRLIIYQRDLTERLRNPNAPDPIAFRPNAAALADLVRIPEQELNLMLEAPRQPRGHGIPVGFLGEDALANAINRPLMDVIATTGPFYQNLRTLVTIKTTLSDVFVSIMKQLFKQKSALDKVALAMSRLLSDTAFRVLRGSLTMTPQITALLDLNAQNAGDVDNYFRPGAPLRAFHENIMAIRSPLQIMVNAPQELRNEFVRQSEGNIVYRPGQSRTFSIYTSITWPLSTEQLKAENVEAAHLDQPFVNGVFDQLGNIVAEEAGLLGANFGQGLEIGARLDGNGVMNRLDLEALDRNLGIERGENYLDQMNLINYFHGAAALRGQHYADIDAHRFTQIKTQAGPLIPDSVLAYINNFERDAINTVLETRRNEQDEVAEAIQVVYQAMVQGCGAPAAILQVGRIRFLQGHMLGGGRLVNFQACVRDLMRLLSNSSSAVLLTYSARFMIMCDMIDTIGNADSFNFIFLLIFSTIAMFLVDIDLYADSPFCMYFQPDVFVAIFNQVAYTRELLRSVMANIILNCINLGINEVVIGYFAATIAGLAEVRYTGQAIEYAAYLNEFNDPDPLRDTTRFVYDQATRMITLPTHPRMQRAIEIHQVLLGRFEELTAHRNGNDNTFYSIYLALQNDVARDPVDVEQIMELRLERDYRPEYAAIVGANADRQIQLEIRRFYVIPQNQDYPPAREGRQNRGPVNPRADDREVPRDQERNQPAPENAHIERQEQNQPAQPIIPDRVDLQAQPERANIPQRNAVHEERVDIELWDDAQLNQGDIIGRDRVMGNNGNQQNGLNVLHNQGNIRANGMDLEDLPDANRQGVQPDNIDHEFMDGLEDPDDVNL